MNHRDFEEQLQDLIDGKLDGETRRRVLKRLKEEPEMLEIYCSYAELESTFRRRTIARAGLSEDAADATRHLVRSSRRCIFRVAVFAAAAIMVLVGVVLHTTLVRNPPPKLSLRTSPGARVDISHISANGEPPAPGTLDEGSRALLSQGSVELEFGTGVRAIVQGPAEFTLRAENQLHLRQGVAWFHVPSQAAGFRVRTPGLTVTDLGTEFGVRTRPHSLDEVHVFEGKVEARTQHGVKAAATLVAGEARAVGIAGRLGEISPDRTHFLTTLPDSLPHLHWSFDNGPRSATAEGSQPAADSKTSRLAGLDNPEAFRATEGRFGKALATVEALAEARSGWAGVEGSAPRTVAHWIKLKPGGPAAQQIVGWGSHALSPFNPNPAFLTYVRRVRSGTVAGVSFGAYHLDGTTPLADDRWHHFAVVYTGRELPDGRPELLCYLDGRPEPMNRGYRSDIISDHAPGAYSVETNLSVSDAIPVTLFPRDWVGDRRSVNMPLALDELYIFEGALNEDQVIRLYEKNRVGS